MYQNPIADNIQTAFTSIREKWTELVLAGK